MHWAAPSAWPATPAARALRRRPASPVFIGARRASLPVRADNSRAVRAGVRAADAWLVATRGATCLVATHVHHTPSRAQRPQLWRAPRIMVPREEPSCSCIVNVLISISSLSGCSVWHLISAATAATRASLPPPELVCRVHMSRNKPKKASATHEFGMSHVCVPRCSGVPRGTSIGNTAEHTRGTCRVSGGEFCIAPFCSHDVPMCFAGPGKTREQLENTLA
eukprot:7391952-Prymnesium_polylepis.1